MTLTSSEVGVLPLTRDDIAALKAADSILARHRDGKSTLVAVLEHTRYGEPRVLTASQQRLMPEVDSYDRRRTLPVGGSVHGYRGVDDTAWRGDSRTTCFEMFHSGYLQPKLQTVIDLMRVGDLVHLEWIGDGGSNGYTKTAVTTTDSGTFTGIHVDELRLHIVRGERHLTFSLDTSACPDNSARMIHRYGD